jgi:hypothetical protein
MQWRINDRDNGDMSKVMYAIPSHVMNRAWHSVAKQALMAIMRSLVGVAEER